MTDVIFGKPNAPGLLKKMRVDGLPANGIPLNKSLSEPRGPAGKS